jgi:cobalt-zinc-cadmium efflux system protein
VEVLSTLGNALLLGAVAVWVLYEAIRRFATPPHVSGLAMIVAATLGLSGNVWAFLLLRRGAREALSIKGASMEVLADTIASVGAIIAGVVLVTTGWRYADPIVAAAVAIMIIPRAVGLGRAAVRVLLEVAPRDLDVSRMEAQLRDIAGVTDVHDLHVWTLTSGMESATAHLSVSDEHAAAAVLARARACLAAHGIEHATVQIETVGEAGCCADSTW